MAEARVGRGKKIDDVSIVVDAAIRLITERGIEEFSTRRLAAALRISAMTLYNYFEDREAILREAAVACLAGFAGELDRDIESSPEASPAAGGNPIRAFKVLARRLFAFGKASPRRYLFIFDSSLGGAREDPEVSIQYKRYADWAAGYVPDAGLAQELRSDILLFELLANSLVIDSIRWPGSIGEAKCEALVDRAYERLLARYEPAVVSGAGA
jgi:AcrR family transcriptional regulator